MAASITLNGGWAVSRGVELAGAAGLTNALRLRGTWSYTRTALSQNREAAEAWDALATHAGKQASVCRYGARLPPSAVERPAWTPASACAPVTWEVKFGVYLPWRFIIRLAFRPHCLSSARSSRCGATRRILFGSGICRPTFTIHL